MIKNEKDSFYAIDKDKIVPDEFTTYFRSVIAFGKIRILENENDIRNAMQKIAEKYSWNESESVRNKEIEGAWKNLCLMEMSIEHITGKQAIDLVTAIMENQDMVKSVTSEWIVKSSSASGIGEK